MNTILNSKCDTGTGNIYKSIDINAERFGISKQLRKILFNTAKYLGYE